MIGSKLRLVLSLAFLFSSMILWLEPYFPSGIFYKSRLDSVFSSFNKDVLELEKDIRESKPEELGIDSSFVPVKTFTTWDPILKITPDLEFSDEKERLVLSQSWEGKISRLLILENEPVLFVPIQEKSIAVLAILDKDRFRISIEDKVEYFVPEPKVGSFSNWEEKGDKADPRRISEELLRSMKDSGTDFREIRLGEKTYRGYYASYSDDKIGFIQGILLLVPTEPNLFLLLFPIFFGLLLALDLCILLVRRNKAVMIYRRSEVSRLIQLLSQRIEEGTFQQIEAKKMQEIPEVPEMVTQPEPATLETHASSSGTFYVLPFDLPQDSFLTPKYLREKRSLEPSASEFTGSVTIAELPPPVQKKRESIFTEELAKLVEKVKTVAPAEEIQKIEISDRPKDSGLLAKALRVTGLAEIGLKAARGLSPQHKSRFFLWARAWWGIRKTDPNEELPLSEKFKTWLEKQPIREKRKILEVLDEIHQGLDTPMSSLLKYYLTIFSSLHLRSFSIHFYDRRRGAYLPVVSYGLQPYSRQNMIFLYGDQFLGKETGDVSIIDVTEEKRNDHFFRKKFDMADLDGVMRIVSFPLFRSGLDFRFFLLFPDPPNNDLADQIRDNVENSIEPVEDAFLQLEIEQASHAIQDKRDLVQIQFLLLRWATHGERSRCNLYKIRPSVDLQYQVLEEWRRNALEKIQPILDSEDYGFGVSPSEIFVLSREERQGQLKEIMESLGQPYEIQTLPYPENGKNLYTYI
ncbi:hypothetical protein EHQ53_07885 [Leptospira langatensis]|uniref:Uncharacterized protein n=1 Tax=Leptospira langatensis TaxID=2484983 RepID=A0A5F1ZW86_9LEPT|nr:hypothetical protein [Leptospira langatensis]TGK01442.1 hypothetical protein EHO57_10985 [Leptospira langatensis]TGL42108.1 hypothetical protein EHQ53_07885 [Leptospira langatensis]